ncbi:MULTISPECIES: energy transducer TonB [Psychrobacter]|jgi:colicin import membrane protein/protein TonB|uniref:Energy transducer TonB n=1 Tax=Psychrobacter pocilloporae TaxID=1775882 RepID=A0ABT6IW98_9GAMM|nr:MULTISPECIES: energy transducer TonB [Psychrobacter]MDH4905472.1 energy transducer TonB [Psychrobacter pocilloporae]HBD04144.1 energy transducer TonB [Psychrobacter sp.]|tara:strand:- start:10665 stop:11645 length:981 start_codon:yes stop_codon:yes gene_type:complete
MSSTDLETPPTRLILLSLLVVVGLHVLTAVALAVIKTPKPQPAPKEDITPVEIEFVTLPANNAVAKVETKEPVQQVKKVTVKKEVQPKPVQKPKAEPPPKKRVETPIEPAKPVVKKVSETPPIIATEKTSTESSQKPVPKEAAPKKISPEPTVDTSAADEQRKEAAARAKKAAQEAQDRAAQEAKRVADAKAAAQAKAAREAEAAAQAQAAREAAEAAAEAAARAQSNEPVSFTASAANWASAPNFSFPDRAARRARSGDTLNVVLVLRVNKQGGIDSVRVAQSSGNTLLDKEAQRQVRSGKFKPFTKNGAPVVGNVTLPISYAVP